jgi:hypothetical protein
MPPAELDPQPPFDPRTLDGGFQGTTVVRNGNTIGVISAKAVRR